jgi:ABC-type polysaccharide/polyol phosphate export permease
MRAFGCKAMEIRKGIDYNTKYLNLLRELSAAQFKLKDQSTFFGYLWSFLNPLIMLLVLFAVFHKKIGNTIPNYAVYLLIGIIQYTHFSISTSVSMRALYSMRDLTRDAIFPKELLVLGSIVATSIEFVISMCLCVLIVVATGIHVGWEVLLLPSIVLLQLLFVTWVSLSISTLFVFVKDIDHIYQLFLRMLFFITPIFYDASILSGGKAKYLALLNPLTHLVTFTRKILIQDASFSIALFLAFFSVHLALLILALKIFRKYEPAFAENI